MSEQREEARKLRKERTDTLKERLLHAAEVLDKPEMTAEDANALSAVVSAFVELERAFPY